MIEFVKGKIVERNPAYVVIETQGGVGYKLNISMNCYERLAGKEDCTIITQLIIRDDMHELFGFIDKEEKELFALLRGVTKIGPNLARMILSSLKPEALKKAISDKDVALISSIKGIGQKTAERIVIELRDSIAKEAVDSGIQDQADGTTSVRREAVAALLALGFSKSPAEKVVAGLVSQQSGSLTVEAIVKEALKKL